MIIDLKRCENWVFLSGCVSLKIRAGVSPGVITEDRFPYKCLILLSTNLTRGPPLGDLLSESDCFSGFENLTRGPPLGFPCGSLSAVR